MTEPTTRFEEAYAALQLGEKKNAINIWSTLSDEGDVTAAWILGAVHFNGWITEDENPDYEKAALYLRQAAERGHCEARNLLAHLLFFGWGIEKDEAEARRWYELAAEQGDDNAQCDLAYLYETGDGGETDLDKSVKWLSRSADHGNAEAQYRLGLANLTGQGTEQNAVMGFFWLVKSSAQGHPSARAHRDELLPFIEPDIARRVFELTLERSSALN